VINHRPAQSLGAGVGSTAEVNRTGASVVPLMMSAAFLSGDCPISPSGPENEREAGATGSDRGAHLHAPIEYSNQLEVY
jgi:hypothetical protein